MNPADYYDPRTMSAEREYELALALLAAVAARPAPCQLIGDVSETVAPPPRNEHGRVDGRTRAGKAWYQDSLDVIWVACRLVEDGELSEEPKPDGGTPWMLSITDAGRERLKAVTAAAP